VRPFVGESTKATCDRSGPRGAELVTPQAASCYLVSGRYCYKRRVTDTPAYAPVPGPVDRDSFFDAQSQHRRASWWFTALSAGAIGLMGIPLSAVISPLLYALAAIALDVVNFVVRTPDVFASLANDSGTTSSAPVPPETVALVVAFIVVPGSVVLLLSWLGVRRLFRRAGSGGSVVALGARPPRTGDLEEQQLVNVVGEMAAAAGVPVPDVMLLDSPVPNAAVVGSRIDDATVVVTTGLLATLDRDETQGVVGQLIGSVGNGDLRIGTTIASVFQTLGLVGSVLRAPAEGRPRTTLRRLLRYAFRRPGADDRAALAELFTQAGADWDADYGKEPGRIKSIVTLPFVVAGGAFSITGLVFGMIIVNPLLRKAWRARRYLADATAVELTRNPDGLARALTTLSQRGDVVPGTEWAAHLFVVGRPNAATRDKSPMPAFQAPVAKRLDRLHRMGSSVAPAARRQTPGQRAALVAVLVVTSPCWLSMVGVMLGAAVMMTGVSLMIDSLFLAPMVAVIHGLLRNLAGG
jgi:Zn-dependent protease with chaperone function